ncbi:MAG: prepilin-type N-terminal cleavage/methylation domain-containing protein [Bacilli bacterium]
MIKRKIQIEYVDVATKAIKFVAYNSKTGEKTKNTFRYTEESFDFDHILQDLQDFLFENQIEPIGKLDVILSSYNITCSTFIVPRNSKSREYLENELSSRFVDYKNDYDTFISQYDFSKDETLCFVSLISKELEFSFIRLAEALGLKIGKIITLSQLLLEKEKKGGAILYQVNPRVSLYIKRFYSIILLVAGGNILDTRLTSMGHEELTKHNIVQRTRSIDDLTKQVLCFIGKHELYNAKITINDFYIYCKDEHLRNQFFTYKNKIPFISVEKEAFDPSLQFKYVFDTTKKKNKGFTLVETIVGMAVFTISSAAIISLMAALNGVMGNQLFSTKINSLASELQVVFATDPASFPNNFIELRCTKGDEKQAILDYNTNKQLYFDLDFKSSKKDGAYYSFTTNILTEKITFNKPHQDSDKSTKTRYCVKLTDLKSVAGNSYKETYMFEKVISK